MFKSAIMKEFAQQASLEVVELRLAESLPLTSVMGIPRVDVKKLIEQSRRRQSLDSLIVSSED